MELPETHLHREQDTNSRAFADITIGMSDGLIILFALAAGLSSVVNSSHTVLMAGIAAIVIGGFAMAIGGYSANKEETEQDREVEENGDQEKEVKQFYANLGLPEEVQRQATEEVIKDKIAWSDLITKGDTSVEKSFAKKQSFKAGINIGLPYIAGGLVPLSPYLLIESPSAALTFSAVITLLFLFVFGWVKGKLTGSNALTSALRMSITGALAAGAAFFVARWFEA